MKTHEGLEEVDWKVLTGAGQKKRLLFNRHTNRLCKIAGCYLIGPLGPFSGWCRLWIPSNGISDTYYIFPHRHCCMRWLLCMRPTQITTNCQKLGSSLALLFKIRREWTTKQKNVRIFSTFYSLALMLVTCAVHPLLSSLCHRSNGWPYLRCIFYLTDSHFFCSLLLCCAVCVCWTHF